MFSCCEAGQELEDDQVLDLHETAGVLAALLRLLHFPPSPPTLYPHDVNQEKLKMHSQRRRYDPATVIPLPLLLSLLFGLVDKYALPDAVSESLSVHLFAHAATYPLPVYGFAVRHGMDKVAMEASQYLMPLASYRLDEVAVIPSVEAYHKVLQLQYFRMKVLRDLVLGEDIFPHGTSLFERHLLNF